MSVSALTQSLAVSRLSLAGLRNRPGSSLVIVLGVACVVGVLLSVLSVAAGLSHAYENAADPNNAIILATEAVGEGGSSISRDTCATLLGAPGVAKGPDGRAVVDCEALMSLPPTEGFAEGTLLLRGVGAEALSLRPNFKIVAGRLFHPGLHELVVGVGAQNMFGVKVGDSVILPDGEWPIVGAFSSGGGILESDLVSDAATVMASARSENFNSALVRLETPGAFDEFEHWVMDNPALTVTAERQVDFYAQSAAPFMAFFTSLAFFVGAVLAIGALFGSLNVMYGTVRARTREIVTLRVFGFGALPIALSVVIEAMLLSLVGASIGVGCAVLLFNGKQSLAVHTVFELSVTPYFVAIGFAWALAISLAGSLLPALRAVRIPVTEGLRETSMH
jgi:putative ABC transport system permease protein